MEIIDLNNDRTTDKNPKVKLFISQPMTGIEMEQIKYQRDFALRSIKVITFAINKLKEFGKEISSKDSMFEFASNEIEIIDNLQEDLPADTHPLEYLGNDIKMLKDADYIYFCKGWEKSKGCNIEFQVAKFYDIPMIFE